MKKFTLISLVFTVLFALGICQLTFAQLLMDENFSYPAGSLLTANGWVAHSGGGTQPITVSTGGLTFTGYVDSGIGNAALLDNTGEDDNKSFPAQSTGTVYVSFMVNVTTSSAGYFFNLMPTPTSTTFRGKVFMDATNHFGVSVGSNTGTFAASAYTPGTTYLLVLKYEIVSGTTNDKVSLFIFNTPMPSAEPGAPTIGPLTDAGQSDIAPGCVALRQFNASQNLQVDGIRVGTSWSDIYANVILPPPSNYPTAFTATAAPFAVNLSWTDAVGGQLPGSYLILASNTNNIVPPVNGTPVPNNTNLASGTGALNVPYGAQSAGFSNLLSSTTYYFKIFPYTNSGSDIAYKTDGTPPEAQATTEDYVIINQKNFEDQLFDPWDTLSVASNKGWTIAPTPPSTNYYAYINGYGGSSACNDWLISPSMDFNSYQNETFTFRTASNYTGPILEVKASTDYITGADPSTATWTPLTATLSPGSWAWTNSGNIDLSSFGGSNVHVAFRYISTSPTIASAWEVDDILIIGKASLVSTVTTDPNFTNITAFSAQGGGNVVDDGGAIITARGLCYSTSPNPTISGTHTTEPGTTGIFTSTMTGLTPNTLYYVKAYATNANGTGYGNAFSFTTLCESLPPLPDFTASNVNITVGQSIDFTDATTYCPNSWNWSFVGGSPMSSNSQNPTGITYNYSGDYNVCLTVTNQYGTQTLCKMAYIHVTGPTNAKLVMTEIMYNPPESGTDSLEFIEIYNNDIQPIDLANFYFSKGVEMIFPSVILNPQSYLLVSKNASAMTNTLHVSSMQWTSGALSNSGEPLVLKDLYGYVVDSVYYLSSPPWDTVANGRGPSLELCDPNSNNADPANWRHAIEFQAKNGAGDSIWASPLAGCSYVPVADFSATDTTIIMGQTVTFTDASSANTTNWHWEFEQGVPDTFDGKTPPPILYSVMGSFDVTLTVTNNAGASVKFRPGFITVGTNGIDDPAGPTGFSLYPNPVKNGTFTLTFTNTSQYLIKVISGFGKTIDIRTANDKKVEYHLNTMEKGLYFIQVTDQSTGQTTTKKLILQ
ncbi:MAG: choice-of-anchor J domain-containing protein [Bacteroidales bacterium]|nr:choice-of-anchor J domain-containing protein [Bacteroidales bacterium]